MTGARGVTRGASGAAAVRTEACGAAASGSFAHLYVHVPFCARRCSYCDFAIAVRRSTPVDEYLAGVRRELAGWRGHAAPLDTLYLGGGTPSRLGGAGVAQLLEIIRGWSPLARGAEVTLEANPDDVTPVAVAAWRAAGVNRVSLGAQSFYPAVLEWMHRTHSGGQIGRAVATLRDGGIANVSLDLIFAIPPALERDWARDLDAALALAPDHISLYGLTIEPRTPLGRWHARGIVTAGADEDYEREYLLAARRVAASGFEHYEVSNFALPARRARHNAAYWAGVRYLGIGPGAHSFDGERRWWNWSAYAAWVARLAAGERVVEGEERLTVENRAAERVYLGLRTSAGLVATAAELALARTWIAAGWLGDESGTLVPTVHGWLRLDAIAAALTAHGSS